MSKRFRPSWFECVKEEPPIKLGQDLRDLSVTLARLISNLDKVMQPRHSLDFECLFMDAGSKVPLPSWQITHSPAEFSQQSPAELTQGQRSSHRAGPDDTRDVFDHLPRRAFTARGRAYHEYKALFMR